MQNEREIASAGTRRLAQEILGVSDALRDMMASHTRGYAAIKEASAMLERLAAERDRAESERDEARAERDAAKEDAAELKVLLQTRSGDMLDKARFFAHARGKAEAQVLLAEAAGALVNCISLLRSHTGPDDAIASEATRTARSVLAKIKGVGNE